MTVLRALCEPGSVRDRRRLFFVFLFFVVETMVASLATLIVAVPGGMLLTSWSRCLSIGRVHSLQANSWTVGYSFASGHTIGATLLYGSSHFL